MSRIFRSLENGPRVHDVDLRTTPMGPQRPDRPAGGIVGARPLGRGERPLSELEMREMQIKQSLENAQRQAEAIQAEAYHAGFEQGERAGEKLVLQKLEPTIQTFLSLIDGLQRDRAALIEEHERELIKVAFMIAGKVLRRAVEMEPEQVEQVVRAALARVTGAQHVTLHLAPIDAQLIEQQMQRARQAADSAALLWPPENLTIVSDEEVARGGCRVETPTGDIDATIENQLRVLRTQLWDE